MLQIVSYYYFQREVINLNKTPKMAISKKWLFILRTTYIYLTM